MSLLFLRDGVVRSDITNDTLSKVMHHTAFVRGNSQRNLPKGSPDFHESILVDLRVAYKEGHGGHAVHVVGHRLGQRNLMVDPAGALQRFQLADNAEELHGFGWLQGHDDDDGDEGEEPKKRGGMVGRGDDSCSGDGVSRISELESRR